MTPITVNGIVLTEKAMEQIRYFQSFPDTSLLQEVEGILDLLLQSNNGEPTPRQRLDMAWAIREMAKIIRILSETSEE